MILFGYLIKDAALNLQGLWLLCLAPEKSHLDPETQVQPIPKTMFSGSTCRFSGTKLNSPKTNHSATLLIKLIRCYVADKVSEKLYFEIIGWAVLDRGTQTFLFKDKNQGRTYLAGFRLLQLPNVSSNITVTTKNLKNDVLHGTYERHSIPRSGATAQKSVGLPMTPL